MIGVQLQAKQLTIFYLTTMAVALVMFSRNCPSSWLVPVDLSVLATSIGGYVVMGIFGLFLVLWPLYSTALILLTISLFVLPKNWSRKMFLLCLPVVPALAIMAWGAYCHISHFEMDSHLSVHEQWTYKVFNHLFYLYYWHFAILTVPILTFPRWEKARAFGILCLILQYCLYLGPLTVAGMACTRCWL